MLIISGVTILTVEGITDMLVTNGGLFKVTNSSLTYFGNQRFTGYGGLLNNIGGIVWHKKRLSLDPAFRKVYLRTLIPKINEVTRDTVEELKQWAGQGPVDVEGTMKRCAIQLIAKIGYGMDTKKLVGTTIEELLLHVSDMFNGFFGAAFDPLFMYKPRNRLCINRTKQAGALLRQLGHDALAKRRLELSNGEKTSSDLLGHSMKIQNSNPWYTDEEIVDDFVTFIVAGHETTANALSFVVALLARHPNVCNRAANEVSRVLGGKLFLEDKDTAQLEYLECVIKESLRLYPVVSMVRRYTHVDTVLGEHLVPKDTQVMTFPFLQGRAEEYWEDPLEFKPERFLDNRSIQKFAFIPFLTGPRKCIGVNFAMLEIKLVIAQIVQAFELKAPHNEDIKTGFKMTLYPKQGTLLYLSEK